jgi:hypothetical protein
VTPQAARCHRAALRVQFSFLVFAYLYRKAGFNPDQPRDRLGRWTDTGGAQYAQNDRQTGYPVDLMEERELGGHGIEAHVGRSPQSLLDEVRQYVFSAQEKRDLADGLREGSFPSLEAANKLVNATIARNRDKIDMVVNGMLPTARLDAQFDSATGYEAYARTERSQAYIRDTYGVRVVIVRDSRVAKGYRVETAFPRNFGR